MQPKIERRCTACCGEDVTVIHEQHVCFELDRGEAGPEGIRPLPVRGGPAPVEDSGLGQCEGAAAEADQARTSGVCPADGIEHGGTAGHFDVRAVGDDQGVRRVGRFQVGDSM